MDKKTKIIITVVTFFVIITVAVIVAVFVLKSGKNGNKRRFSKISSVDDLKSLVEEIYKDKKPFPTLETREINISENSDVKTVTGIDNGDDFEYLVVSEPMISSQAYSLVIGKVKTGVSSDNMARKMFENIDPRKWICVSAEKVCATSSGDLVMLVMTDKSNTDTVYKKFKELVGNVNKEYSKDVQETEFGGEVDGEFSSDMEVQDGLGNPVISVNEVQ